MGKLNLYEKLVKYDEFFALSQVCLNNLMLLKNNSNAPLKKTQQGNFIITQSSFRNTDYSCFSTVRTSYMPPSKFENDQCHILTFANWASFYTAIKTA